MADILLLIKKQNQIHQYLKIEVLKIYSLLLKNLLIIMQIQKKLIKLILSHHRFKYLTLQ